MSSASNSRKKRFVCEINTPVFNRGNIVHVCVYNDSKATPTYSCKDQFAQWWMNVKEKTSLKIVAGKFTKMDLVKSEEIKRSSCYTNWVHILQLINNNIIV